MSNEVVGRRRYLTDDDHILEPGDYGFWQGLWHCRPPWRHAGGCLGDGTSHHKVTENADGTITATPSILITTHVGTWHGYLTNGVWKEC